MISILKIIGWCPPTEIVWIWKKFGTNFENVKMSSYLIMTYLKFLNFFYAQKAYTRVFWSHWSFDESKSYRIFNMKLGSNFQKLYQTFFRNPKYLKLGLRHDSNLKDYWMMLPDWDILDCKKKFGTYFENLKMISYLIMTNLEFKYLH